MELKIGSKVLSFFFFAGAIFFVPINYDFFSFRITDFLIQVSFFTIIFFKIHKSIINLFLYLLLILFVLLLSSIFGFINNYSFNYGGLFFIYKWLSIFQIVYLCNIHIIKSDLNKKLLLNLIFGVFIFLVLWVYIYFYLVLQNIIIGNLRVSFPFSNDYSVSDAHLYSSLLGIFLLFYVFIIKFNLGHGLILSLIVFFLTFGSLFLTGSRNGIIFFFLGTILSLSIRFMYYLNDKLKLKVVYLNYKFLYFSLFVFLFFSFLLFYLFVYKDFFLENQLIDRATNFDFSSDESSLSRIKKFEISLRLASPQFFIFGVGPLFSPIIWFDGLISILIAHGGVVLLSLFVMMVLHLILFILKFTISKFLKINILIFFIVYLLMNLVTEYLFITRNFFPIIVLFSIALTYNKLNKSES